MTESSESPEIDSNFHDMLKTSMIDLATNTSTPNKESWEKIMEELESTPSRNNRTRFLAVACSSALVVLVVSAIVVVFATGGSDPDKVRSADDTESVVEEPIETSTTTSTTTTTTIPETTTTIPQVNIPGIESARKMFNDETFVLSLVDVGSCSPINCGGFSYDDQGQATDLSTNDLIFVATNLNTGKVIWQTDRLNATQYTSVITKVEFGETEYSIFGQGSIHAMPNGDNNLREFTYDAHTKAWDFGY